MSLSSVKEALRRPFSPSSSKISLGSVGGGKDERGGGAAAAAAGGGDRGGGTALSPRRLRTGRLRSRRRRQMLLGGVLDAGDSVLVRDSPALARLIEEGAGDEDQNDGGGGGGGGGVKGELDEGLLRHRLVGESYS